MAELFVCVVGLQKPRRKELLHKQGDRLGEPVSLPPGTILELVAAWCGAEESQQFPFESAEGLPVGRTYRVRTN
ncbi:hypothetical protein H7X87_01455 [Acetobacteraceae bacterium]|nr:hypothetical protein [Candidatus Parcubacteria bacterium]